MKIVDVAERPVPAPRQPPPQRRLLDEAELARDAEARLVARLDPDLDPVRLADLEADPRRARPIASVAMPWRVALARTQ